MVYEAIYFTITLVLLIIILAMMSNFHSETKKNMTILNKHIITVYKKLKELETNPEYLDKKEAVEEIKIKPSPVDIKPIPVVVEETKPKEIIEEVKKEEIIEEEIKPIQKEEIKVEKPIEELIKPITEDIKDEVIKEKINQEAFKEQPKKEKRDFEKIIGENLLNKIGIAILVIGIGFFVKYAIDKNWIGEFGRVAIGIGVGLLLCVIAHFLRKNFRAFSSVLIGGGIGVFYYTISIAYHDYHIFTQPAAFAIMSIITIFSVVMSLVYDRKEIAIIGLIGGFTSPFFVQGEHENYVAFFTYLAILNTGMLALSYFKKWKIINQLAYGFTILFFGTWLIKEIYFDRLPEKFSVLVSTIFYFQFLLGSLLYNIKNKIKFNAFEMIQITSINAFYFFSLVFVLRDFQGHNYAGVYSLSLAVINLLIAYITKRIVDADKNLPVLFLIKSLTFLTLAILIQFDSYYATLFWSLEAVAFILIAKKTNFSVLRNASAIVFIVALVGLVVTWFSMYNQTENTLFFDKTFLCALFSIVLFIFYFILLSKEKEEEDKTYFYLPVQVFKGFVLFTLFSVVYFTCLIKINSTVKSQHLNANVENLIYWTYNLVFCSIVMFYNYIKRPQVITEVFFALSSFLLIFYVMFANQSIIHLRNFMTMGMVEPSQFLFHFITVFFVAGLLFLLKKVSEKIIDGDFFPKIYSVFTVIITLFIISFELDHLAIYGFYQKYPYQEILNHTQTEGYTTLWAVFSFVIMIFGMKNKNTFIRILSLAIFAFTLLKLFVYDIQKMTDAGKIIAFISLGLLLLIISFLYQKLKKIIVKGEIK